MSRIVKALFLSGFLLWFLARRAIVRAGDLRPRRTPS